MFTHNFIFNLCMTDLQQKSIALRSKYNLVLALHYEIKHTITNFLHQPQSNLRLCASADSRQVCSFVSEFHKSINPYCTHSYVKHFKHLKIANIYLKCSTFLHLN